MSLHSRMGRCGGGALAQFLLRARHLLGMRSFAYSAAVTATSNRSLIDSSAQAEVDGWLADMRECLGDFFQHN